MKNELPLLQYVRVAAPCPADWNEMREVEGDRVKFCSGCQKRVYNLSALGQAEAEGLLRRHEGHLCVRYYRRRDGTILTTDCPVGLKAARTLVFQRAKVSFAACVLFCIGFAAHRTSLQPREQGGVRMRMPVTEQVVESIDPSPYKEDTKAEPLMGVVTMSVDELEGKLDNMIAVPSEPYGQEKGATQQTESRWTVGSTYQEVTGEEETARMASKHVVPPHEQNRQKQNQVAQKSSQNKEKHE